jgi:hypothetical protein
MTRISRRGEKNGGLIPEEIHVFDALHDPRRTYGTLNQALSSQHFRASATPAFFSCLSCLSWLKTRSHFDHRQEGIHVFEVLHHPGWTQETANLALSGEEALGC